MGIKKDWSYMAMCDICGDWVSVYYITKAQFVSQLQRIGWHVGRHVFCPECVKRRNAERVRVDDAGTDRDATEGSRDSGSGGNGQQG